MHAWGAVDIRIYLAKKKHGYSISAKSYDFCPCLIKLDILDFTLSRIEVVVVVMVMVAVILVVVVVGLLLVVLLVVVRAPENLKLTGN